MTGARKRLRRRKQRAVKCPDPDPDTRVGRPPVQRVRACPRARRTGRSARAR